MQYKIEDFLNIKHSTAPSFSPNGDKVAFLSNISGTNQIYLVDSTGGEPKQITFYDDSVSDAVFSPVDNKILFTKAIDGNERNQIFIYDLNTNDVKDLTNDPEHIFRFGGWSTDGRFITYSSNNRNGKDFDVFVMNVESLETKSVFSRGGWCNALGFSSSGKFVTVLEQRTFFDHNLFLVELSSGNIELLTPHQGDAEYGRPRWLNDETGFYVVSNEDSDFCGLTFLNITTKKAHHVLETKWDINNLQFRSHGQKLAIVVNENGFGIPYLYKIESGNLIEDQSFPKNIFADGVVEDIRFSNDAEKFAVVFNSPVDNTNIFVWSNNSGVINQITNNPLLVPKEYLVRPELIHYKSFDGLEIPAFLFLPKERSGRLPVLVSIHGGPEGQSQPIFNSLIQYYVSRGYAVVAPNVRGSSGYGKQYMLLDNIELRPNTFKDLEYLHKYLSGRAEFDSSKFALMGGSYGGYMVLAGLAFQPNLWAAGVDIVGMSNLVSFLENTSSWRRALREAEYGYLDKDREFLQSISPLNSIENIKAPLFIIHGANDPRVPLTEAEQIHSKLKELGRDVELLVYSDEGHGIGKLKNRLDAYPKVANFLDSHLKSE